MVLEKNGNGYLRIRSFFRYTVEQGHTLCKIRKTGKGYTYGKDLSGI